MSESVMSRLRAGQQAAAGDIDASLHYLAPHVPKAVWNGLGDLVSARERDATGQVDGSQWISLRLDGCGFSKAVRMLRNIGVLEEDGFSETFAESMQQCLRGLMEKFGARIGYTQSDEMVVFIPPTNIVRGERQPHLRNGRVTKLATLAASQVTAHFLMELAQHCRKRGADAEGLASVLPHFDCRLGHYASWEEASALLLWRAYDCSVNGVSDAVYQVKGSGKKLQGAATTEKLQWLKEQGRLPLPRHQAYGTVLVRVKRSIEGHNPKLGTTVKTLRGVIERLEGPVLELARTDRLFPADDEVA